MSPNDCPLVACSVTNGAGRYEKGNRGERKKGREVFLKFLIGRNFQGEGIFEVLKVRGFFLANNAKWGLVVF